MMNKFHSENENLNIKLSENENLVIKLKGNGLCQCDGCLQKKGWNRIWTNFCWKYKGKIYCEKCLKEQMQKDRLKFPPTNYTIYEY